MVVTRRKFWGYCNTGVDLGSKDDAYYEGLDESITRKLRPHFGKNKAAAQTSIQKSTCRKTDSEHYCS